MPAISVTELASVACLSKKQFERLFNELVGQCGYADQSHFIREFKQFSGYTPLSLLNVCKPYSDLFNNPA